MNDKEKLKVIKHYLEETYKDSREYMDSFYDDCQNGEIDDLDWLASDNQMDDFVIVKFYDDNLNHIGFGDNVKTHEEALKKEKCGEADGLFLGGNYVAGVAFGRCVEYGVDQATDVLNFLDKKKRTI